MTKFPYITFIEMFVLRDLHATFAGPLQDPCATLAGPFHCGILAGPLHCGTLGGTLAGPLPCGTLAGPLHCGTLAGPLQDPCIAGPLRDPRGKARSTINETSFKFAYRHLISKESHSFHLSSFKYWSKHSWSTWLSRKGPIM